MTTPDPRARLLDLLDDASEDEVHLLVLIASRLEAGRKKYGPLSLAADRRCWSREASEELLDEVVGAVGKVVANIEALKEVEAAAV